MGRERTFMTFALLADIHGNRWALEAVLEELDRLAIREIVDLGDRLYGPLDPGGTLELLRQRSWPSVRGNMDRVLLESAPSPPSRTHEFVRGEIGDAGIEWIQRETRAPFVLYGAFHCHGTPERDDRYLIEVVDRHAVRMRDPAALDESLGGVTVPLVSCAHSHVPRLVGTDGRATIVNPGSVGLPAYEEDTPFPHAMESGSPHARFAVIEASDEGCRVRHIAVAYNYREAARVAQSNGRSDWHDWLLTGRTSFGIT
jgi:predicted phosphodiesterase